MTATDVSRVLEGTGFALVRRSGRHRIYHSAAGRRRRMLGGFLEDQPLRELE